MRVNVYLRKYVTKTAERRWYLVVRETGRADHHVALGPISRKTAEERRVLVLNDLLQGTYRRVSEVRPYFGEFCDKFLKDFAAGRRAESTVRLYEYNLGIPKREWQGLKLDEIRREDVDRFLSGLSWAGRTKNILLSILHLLFQTAVEWRYIAKSPTDGMHRWREEKGGSRSLTMQELARVLDVASPWVRSVIKVMVYSGMRPGELAQLKFQDIDWDTKTLKIVSDFERKTKNRKSRIVPLSPELEQELKFLQDHWPNLQYGEGSSGEPFLPRTEIQREYVFCHRDGKRSQSFKKSLSRAFEKAGISGVTPHGLRKTFCSLLARQKVHPKVAQQLLGHSDVRLTMDIYTEVETDQLRDAVMLLPSLRDIQKEKLRVVGA